jgi:alpha-L-glutamate ligase-like protein
MNRRNIAHVMPRNPRRLFPLANNKVLAKQVLGAAGIELPETLCLFKHFFELNSVAERLAPHQACVIKPAHGAGGRGILVLERVGDHWQTAGGRAMDVAMIRRHIGDIIFGAYSLDRPDVAIVETRLRPHQFFADLYPRGLSDIRIIVVDRVPVLAMIRVPTDASDGKANLHQGGLGLGLNLKTGQITQSWLKGAPVAVHPDTGVPTNGSTVPNWDLVVACAVRCAEAVELKYLGVDLVLASDGRPMVLEINVRPGLEIQNVTGTPLRKQMADLGIEELS